MRYNDKMFTHLLRLLALMVIASLAITACAAPAPAPAQPAKEQPAKGKEAEEPVTISLWGGWPEIEPFYQKVAEEYRKDHPNVTVEILTHPLREFEQKLSATIPADTASDIVEASPYVMYKFIEAGLIPPNPDYVNEFVQAEGRYEPVMISDSTYQGDIYGLPYFQGRHAMFWNIDMFEEAGLSGPPETLDQVVEYAQKLAKYDEAGNLKRSGVSLRLSGGGSGVAEKFWMYLFPHGGSIIEKTGDGKYQAGYNNEAGRNALQMYVDLVHKYKADSHEIKHDAEAFALEQTAMFVRESWVIGYMGENAPEVAFDTAIMPRGERWGDLATGVSLYVTRNSEHPDVAWDFAQFIVSPENQRLLLDMTGWLPQRIDVDYEEILERKPQFRAFMFGDPEYQIYTYPPLPEYDEIMTKLAERLVSAYLDESFVDNPEGVAKVLEEAAAETNQILKDADHYGGE